MTSEPLSKERHTFTAEHSQAYFSGFVFAGVNILLISWWQATEATAKGMTIALLRSAILPPIFILLIPMYAGVDFFWYGHSVAETLTAVVALILLTFHRGKKEAVSKLP